jgi:arylsulfatase A-like enzyme
VAAAGLILALACGRATPVEEPLLDSRHRPIVLTERRTLALPNAPPGNRFVRGWRFEEKDHELRIRPAGTSAFIEVVPDGSVRAWSPGGQLGSFELTGNVVIPLPADLGPGRVPIELEFMGSAVLVGATVSEARPRGRVEVEGADVTQAGWSAVEFVRWVGGGARLVGELVPPPGMSPKQKFSIVIDRGDDQAVTNFEMKASPSTGTEDVRYFDLPLLDASGLVRIRLTAEGRGAAGRWRNLGLVSPRSAAARAPVTVPEPPKLVVLYVLDALRGDHVGHLGSTLGATPCIDRLAAEGVAFTNHFSVAPNTGPATKALFTGHGFLKGRRLAAEGPATLAEIFAAAGFATASISSNFNVSPGLGMTRGFEHIELVPLHHEQRDGIEATINDSAERIHTAALRWLERQQGDRRLFLYLHSLNPHNPYTPPAPFPNRFVDNDPSPVDGRTETLTAIRYLDLEVTPKDEERIRQWYTAGLAYNDAELCKFVDGLRRRFPGDVMFVVTSDHGEELFDHGGVLHGLTLYDELLHVPLVMWWPDEVSPTVIDEPTDTLDLHATLRVLIGPQRPREPEDGDDLWGAIAGSAGATGEPRLHFATAPGLLWATMARSDHWKLILVPGPRLDWGVGRGRGRTHEAEYLFNLDTDPGEQSNLTGSSSIEADWLWSRLKAWQAAWRARQPLEVDRRELDETTKRQLEALGYVE